ncbi:FAD/NAD(P)-binding protein [Pseudomonas simiae]|uniref:FAD/NAD(P)-binding protein n=1 Tax=Pseudomonas simiae TaxID=321846 RepID=UPI0027343641|nr:FAD/NAD(P)-binding protein [Pseudomonas simiae]WLH99772.1 FAD/NAD(P)-binding protein [Pseudomonas simiae]
MKTQTIAIIGAGFCGSTLAVRLLRNPTGARQKILLISRPGAIARGIAYGTRSYAHLLNVPAGRMNALSDDEDSFYAFAKNHDSNITSGSFVQRRLYGDYLESLLSNASQNAAKGCELHNVIGEVVEVIPNAERDGARLIMNNGDHLEVDKVVLSIGSCARQKPSSAAGHQLFYANPRYIHDPWKADALSNVGSDAPIFLIGSGLTMLDVVLDLRDRGHQGMIYAVSRRGLAPQPHRALNARPSYDEHLSRRMLDNCTIRHYLRTVRDAIMHQARTGGDWRDVIGGLRSTTAQLWHALPIIERQRFLRHVRPYWDTHRHRCAPQPGARLQAEIASGKLKLFAGRVTGYTPNEDHVSVSFQRRGTCIQDSIEVGAVINCTTPAFDLRELDDPLLESLRIGGLLIPDALGTSMAIAPSGALVGCDGTESSWLYYVGPFLQARDWEATAVPELREYVKSLAETLSQ